MAAGGTSDAGSLALEQLCKSYWPPIYAHLRRKGLDVHQAQDLTQEFFMRLLAARSFADVSPAKGRFRSFLLAALKHFLLNEWKKDNAQKRGGGKTLIHFDSLDAATRDSCEPRATEDPEQAYERRWSLTLLARVSGQLKKEYAAVNQLERHEALKSYLLDAEESANYASTAAQLGISEAATKSAIYKIRQRFGQLLRAEISRTVTTEDEVEDELRHLITSLHR